MGMPLLLVLGPVLLATLAPGPSMLLALDHGVCFGTRRALATAFGNVAATGVQAALCLAGLHLVALELPWCLGAVRLVGALYLGSLGLQMLRLSRRRDGLATPAASASTASRRFRQAFFVAFWNPTAYLFFTALFPPFLGSPAGLSRLLLGLILPTLAITFSCMMLYARCGQSLVRFLRSPGRAQAFRWVMGLSFLALGGWMLLRA